MSIPVFSWVQARASSLPECRGAVVLLQDRGHVSHATGAGSGHAFCSGCGMVLGARGRKSARGLFVLLRTRVRPPPKSTNSPQLRSSYNSNVSKGRTSSLIPNSFPSELAEACADM